MRDLLKRPRVRILIADVRFGVIAVFIGMIAVIAVPYVLLVHWQGSQRKTTSNPQDATHVK
jgi:hypothetical protein